MTLTETAYAKINLYLHVVGKRADGYHLLDSLVCFTRFGDQVYLQPHAHKDSLQVIGPFAQDLPDNAENLILKILPLLRQFLGISAHFSITLDKRIPIAAGLGGGSADAAAIIRAVLKSHNVPLSAITTDAPHFIQHIVKFGADIPVCLHSKPAHMQGIGENITLVDMGVKNIPCLLVNNRVPCQTSAVFQSFHLPYQTAASAKTYARITEKKALLLQLLSQKNALETAAMNLVPTLKQLKSDLNALPNVEMVRLTGSGGTFFAIFANNDLTKNAAKKLAKTHPDLWITASALRA